MEKDIVAGLLNMANAHANGEEAELLNAAASEIDLLRDERDDLEQRGTAYKEALKHCWDALNAGGIHANGDRTIADAITELFDVNTTLREQNADLLAALHIVKNQRQHWWSKAVERGRAMSRAEAAEADNARLLQSSLASQRDADTLLEKLHAVERERDRYKTALVQIGCQTDHGRQEPCAICRIVSEALAEE